MDITGLLLVNATQSPTPSMSRNPVDRLEADTESPRRGNHAAMWQGGPRKAGQPVISVYTSNLAGLQVPVAMLLATSTGSNDISYLNRVQILHLLPLLAT